MIKYQEIPVEHISVNDWNPNEMTDELFELLADNMRRFGFIDPILVTENGLDEDGSQLYRIIDGEHRFEAQRSMGSTMIPAIILDDVELKDQKILTVRTNNIHGEANPTRLKALIQDLIQNHDVSEGEMMYELGYDDIEKWESIVADHRKALPNDANIKKEYDRKAKGAKTVQDLQRLVEALYKKFGDSEQANYMVFNLGRRRHIWVMLQQNAVSLITEKFKECMELGYTVDSMLVEMLASTDIRSFVETRRESLTPVCSTLNCSEAAFEEMVSE